MATSEQTAINKIVKDGKETFDQMAGTLNTGVEALQDYEAQTGQTTEAQETATEMGKNFQVQLEKIGGAARDAMGTLQKGIDVLESFGIISGDTATALSGAVSNISGGIGAITGGYEAITKKE